VNGPSPRVVSLIASGTEIVAGLGMADHLVGRSHSCDHPPVVASLPVLSEAKVDPSLPSGAIDRDVRTIVERSLSVYRIDVDRLVALAPDVIVTQDHCEVCAVSLSDVEDALSTLDLGDVRVCSLRPRSLADVREDIRAVASALGVAGRGESLVTEMDDRLERLRSRTVELVGPAGAATRPRVALVEWLDPPMIAGGWMPELARIAGGEPVLVTDVVHSPEVRWTDIAEGDPDVVVVLPCGFDVRRSIGEMEVAAVREGLRSIRAVREGRCVVVDGHAYLNRPSHRLAESAELLAGALHPWALPDLAERYGRAIAPVPVGP